MKRRKRKKKLFVRIVCIARAAVSVTYSNRSDKSGALNVSLLAFGRLCFFRLDGSVNGVDYTRKFNWVPPIKNHFFHCSSPKTHSHSDKGHLRLKIEQLFP